MNYYVWVGPRDIDCLSDTLFSEKICYYSDSNPQEIRQADIYGNIFTEFISCKMTEILSIHPHAQFIFYNPKIAYSIDYSLRQYILCLNDNKLLDLLSDKIYTRYWFGHYVPALPSIIIDSPNLSFNELETNFMKSKQYVVQKNKSSGGFGTFIISESNHMLENIRDNYRELFIVSPYVKNGFSVNINAIISAEHNILFSPSIQITEINNQRILYHGSDYIAAQTLSDETIKKLNSYTSIILDCLKNMGYLGIIGLDFLVTEKEIYFLEINPRYQASSFLINIALKEYNLPSLSQLNMSVFYNGIETSQTDLENIRINYSFYKYIYAEGIKHPNYVYQRAHYCSHIYKIVTDGWTCNTVTENDAYCYSLIFKTNICSISPDFQCNIYSNISGEEKYLQQNINTDIGIKIALLNQGCNISKEVSDYLKLKGVIKKAVFSAIDFRTDNNLPLNVPINLKFTELSPFSIELYSNELNLFYYDKKISKINIELEPDWSNKITKNGIPYNRIAYLSTDRLRLKHESICTFKSQGMGCYFCNLPAKQLNISTEDFDEVLDYLILKPTFRHILIGGGSGNPNIESENIIMLTQKIRERNKAIPIYLMSLPPANPQVLYRYKEAGIDEVAFNIEIWDRDLAQRVMPGKGTIPLAQYIEALKVSTIIWGKNGNVRSALIVGLNSHKTLLEAIKYLCQLGVQPMLSVFRPMIGTKLENTVAPTNQALLSIYRETADICANYQLELGPTCKECRNNMLAL